jgi:hypothetical protein
MNDSWSLQEEDGNEIGFLEETGEDEAQHEAQGLANQIGRAVFLVPLAKRHRFDPQRAHERASDPTTEQAPGR